MGCHQDNSQNHQQFSVQTPCHNCKCCTAYTACNDKKRFLLVWKYTLNILCSIAPTCIKRYTDRTKGAVTKCEWSNINSWNPACVGGDPATLGTTLLSEPHEPIFHMIMHTSAFLPRKLVHISYWLRQKNLPIPACTSTVVSVKRLVIGRNITAVLVNVESSSSIQAATNVEQLLSLHQFHQSLNLNCLKTKLFRRSLLSMN